jgi:integrase/recombinase XerD
MTASPTLASLLQRFFTDRLVRQQRASPHTVASYRDAFRLLLRFAQERLGKAPSTLALDDLDAAFVGAFLDHVEQHRRNTPRTRNVRLAAIHAFCRTWRSASRRISIAAGGFSRSRSSGTSDVRSRI